MNRVTRAAALAALAAMIPGPAGIAPAQSVLERPPNLEAAWVGAPGQLHFNFLHRFTMARPPTRNVSVSPTFLLAAPLPGRALAGVRYASNSDLVAGVPNEWEFLGRIAPLDSRAGAPVDLGVQLGFNEATRSADAELSLARALGGLRLVGAGRAFSDGYAEGDARFAVGAGAVWRVRRSVALAGDLVTLLDRSDDERAAWSAGIQLVIPHTPHTISLHATNTGTGSLQGSSRGSGRTRFGFEFTVPVTIARYISRPPPPAPDRDPVVVEDEDGVEVFRADMRSLAFVPARIEIPAGTTIVWTNSDEVEHTVTEDEGRWDSGTIEAGEEWRRTFREPGTFTFHCVPHPFMTGVIVVRPATP